MRCSYAPDLNRYFASLDPDLPLPGQAVAALPADLDGLTLLFARPLGCGRDAFAVAQASELDFSREDVRLLSLEPATPEPAAPELPPTVARLLGQGQLRAVNRNHPRWLQLALPPEPPRSGLRLNLIAVGDVGGTLLTGLRLLAAGLIAEIGLFDLDAAATARWAFELEQVWAPGLEPPPPRLRVISAEQVYDCDILVFCASRGVPGLDAGGDVRLRQWPANRELIRHYAQGARQAQFRGLLAVVSDPVDLLARAAWELSNRDRQGRWDGQGLSSEQVVGLGLGVMYARACYYSRRDPRLAHFIQEGAAFGPHGAGLVIADSLTNYNDDLSRELTDLAATANLQARQLGFKPYVAPALSSALYPLLALLQGQPHYAAVAVGEVFFGSQVQRRPAGLSLLPRKLPPALRQRLLHSEAQLKALYNADLRQS